MNLFTKLRNFFSVFFYNFSFLLVYLSFVTYFIKNNPELIKVVFSDAGIIFFIVSVLIQLFFNYLMRITNWRITKLFYLTLIFYTFAFLNLTYFFNYFADLNIITNGLLRVRYTIILFFLLLFLVAILASKKFQVATRVINTFLITFIITSVFFTNFHTKIFNINNVSKTTPDINEPAKQEQSKEKKKIILIVLDEYGSAEDISKYQSDKAAENSYFDYLKSKGFLIVRKNSTKEIETESSLNQLFNKQSGLSFENKRIEQVALELNQSFVIKTLENRGYIFKNFSCFSLANHKEFYYVSPFPRNNFDILLKNSMSFLVESNLKLDNFTNFTNFYIYADYNKKVFNESLDYINGLNLNSSHFVFVHLLLPHPPFYSENEFADKPINLENYVTFWNFTNRKIQSYLDSIEDLPSYKIIVTGDHGFRRDKRLNPYLTTSIFYNFDSTEVSKLSNVQDIGNLLLKE